MYRRHSEAIKEEVVRKYEAGAPIGWLAREYGFDKHAVKIWIGRYKLGKPISLRRGRRRKIRAKEEIIAQIKKGLSTDKACIIYDIGRSTVLKWKRDNYEETQESQKHKRVGSGERVFAAGEFGIKNSGCGKKMLEDEQQ